MTGILKQQKQYAKEDLIDGKYVPFVMILDQGYRITMAAWTHGQRKHVSSPFLWTLIVFLLQMVWCTHQL